MELLDLIGAFLDARRAEGLSGQTVQWYADHLTVFYRWLRSQPGVNPADRRTIAAYYAHRAGEVSPETVDGDHRTLRVFYKWLVAEGHLGASPVDAIKRKRAKRRPQRRVELGDFRRLLDSIEPLTWIDLRDRLLIAMLFLCGVRVSEAVSCTVESVDTRNKLLTVTGKTGTRLVPLLPQVVDAFVAYMYARPAGNGGALFLSAKGDLSLRGDLTANGVRQMLRRRCEAAGVPYVNPHAFRHGLAMYLLNRGGDMSLVQRVLGHSRITTTAEHYARWLTDDLSREFTNLMDKDSGLK